MESKKNTPPKGVLVAILVIVLMIVIYFVLATWFPELLGRMNVGEAQPVQ